MYVPACQHHDRACAGCGRQLAWTWPGRGAVRAQHAVHCSRGPARTLGFIIYIYQQVCRLWCVHFIRTSDMARFGRLPLKNCRRLSLGHRSRCARRGPPAAALVKKNRLPLKNCRRLSLGRRPAQWARAQGAPHRYLGEKYFPKTPSALGRRPARSPPAPRAHARAPPPPALVEKKVEGGGRVPSVYGQNRCCNVRAESQQIVRQAYSHAYNTPLRDKVVYNVSIFPDGRVVMQESGPAPARRCGPSSTCTVQGDCSPIGTRVWRALER